jgi:hypothetical protein
MRFARRFEVRVHSSLLTDSPLIGDVTDGLRQPDRLERNRLACNIQPDNTMPSRCRPPAEQPHQELPSAARAGDTGAPDITGRRFWPVHRPPANNNQRLKGSRSSSLSYGNYQQPVSLAPRVHNRVKSNEVRFDDCYHSAIATPALADDVGVRVGPVGAGVSVGESHDRDRDRTVVKEREPDRDRTVIKKEHSDGDEGKMLTLMVTFTNR